MRVQGWRCVTMHASAVLILALDVGSAACPGEECKGQAGRSLLARKTHTYRKVATEEGGPESPKFTGQHAEGSTLPWEISGLQFEGALDGDPVPLILAKDFAYVGQIVPCLRSDQVLQCQMSNKLDHITAAHAVVWNARLQNLTELSSIAKPPGQVWIFTFDFEPPLWGSGYLAEDVTNALNDRIDLTMTYKSDSDIWWPYQRLASIGSNMTQSASPVREPKLQRPYLLLAFISDCMVQERLQLLKELQGLLPGQVHVYGECGVPSPCPGRDESDQCHQDLFADFFFFAAFENHRCSGYITEKFFRGFQEGMVPLALGGMDRHEYEQLAPASSFIHVDDFSSVEAMARYLTNVSQDAVAYSRYFNWRSKYVLVSRTDILQQGFCDVCQKLHNPPASRLLNAGRAQRNISEWWYKRTCSFDGGPRYVER